MISKSGLGAIRLQLYLLIMHMGPGLCLTHQTARTQFVLTSDKGRQFGEPVNIENDRHGSIRQENLHTGKVHNAKEMKVMSISITLGTHSLELIEEKT